MALKKTIPTKTSTTTAEKSVKKVAVKKTPAKKAASPKKAASKKTASVKPESKAKKEAPKSAKKTAVKSTKTKASAIVKPKAGISKSAVQLLVDAAVDGVLEVKGKNISVLDLKEIHNRVCDYYIICQADSSTQVNAIAGSVEKMVKDRIGERPYHTEGFQNSEWILVDYVTVVVHVFQSQVREFYNLEALWADAEVTRIAFD
ncbi:MAG: ribosome silencing factor [Bacteroidota bacterium]